MSKSRNRKWYDDYDADYEKYKANKKGEDRRSKKKLKNDLRSKSYEPTDHDDEHHR